MNAPSRAELLRQLYTRLGGSTTLKQLARAAITDGIFPADIRRDTALAGRLRYRRQTDCRSP